MICNHSRSSLALAVASGPNNLKIENEFPLPPHSYHCPPLRHITILPSTPSHHCPPLLYKNR